MGDDAPRPRRFGRRARTAALIFSASAGFLAYAWLLLWHASFSAGGSDSSGYLSAARLITAGRVVAPVDALEQLDLPESDTRLFIPLGFVPGPRPGTMAPQYPPGLPILMALAGIIAGWNYGPFLVGPFAALASVLLMYLAARELGLSRLFSASGAAVLALCPVLVFQAEQPMSDVVAAAWALAAALFALRSRRAGAWAVAAGAAFGMSVLVRPADILLLVALLFALKPRLRTILLFAAGAAPFAALYLAWNRAAFGNFFATGYSADLGAGFAVANFPEHFRSLGLSLVRLFSPIVPAGWLLVGADRRVSPRDRLFLVAWFALFFLFYCFWGVDGAWWYTRFLLPGIPALVLASLLVVRDGLGVTKAGRGAAVRRGLATALLLVVLLVEQQGIRSLGVLRIGEGEKLYADASRWTDSKVPPGSFVVSMQMSGALRYYTALLPVRWDSLDPAKGAALRDRVRIRGRSLYALLAPFEIERARERFPGAWTKIGAIRDVSLWKAE